MDSDKKVVGIDNNLEVDVNQAANADISAGTDVSLEAKPIEVSTSFDTTVDVKMPEFRAGVSGFNLQIFGMPIFGMGSCFVSSGRASEVFGELFFGEESTSAIPAYKITDKCIGCSTCARQCPTGAIYGVMKQRFNIEPSQCISCGTCGRACPASAIVDPDGNTVQRVKPKEKKVPVVDEELCSGCGSCVSICPFNCLAIKEDEAPETIKGVSYLEKKAKCVACGECERICAQEAIVLQPPVVEPTKKVA